MVVHAPLPLDEKARLASLHSYRLLDTEPDADFDLFTRMATWLFDVPLSAINLVDQDKTFFKSLIGLARYQPARCTSICAHAVGAGDDLMVIEDLSADERFHDHPIVTGGMRFYAGALLRSDTGHALGTLCVADRQPRIFPEASREKLAALAKGVDTVLKLQRNGLRLLDIASQDALTGLCSRRLFEEQLREAIATAKTGQHYALVFLDVDRFKSINDRFGHAGGDAMLVEVGRRLIATAGPDDVVARLAGDEFVLLVKGRRFEASVSAQASALACRLLAAFAAPFDIDETPVEIRSSIGIALYPEHARGASELLRCADEALYRAKEGGRSRYCLHQAGFTAALVG